MRKNCARKWLHFTIDLLPFVVIPIFAIWSINHGNANQTANVIYKYDTNVVESVDDLIIGNVYHLDSLSFDDVNTGFDVGFSLRIYSLSLLNVEDSDDFHQSDEFGLADYVASNENYLEVYFECVSNDHFYLTLYFTNGALYGGFNIETPVQFLDIDFSILESLDDVKTYFEGNYLPTSSTYNEILTVETVDEDISEAFFNSLYNTTTKYFNFDNVFNFGALKQWFVTNWFGGNMPQVFEIIYNVIIYEFLSDIIMLIYAFFMFIIDFANDLLEKPFSDIKRG